MACERPYVQTEVTDCVDFVRAEHNNKQERQLAGLTAQVPLCFNLPQFDLAPDTGVTLCHITLPTGKQVCRAVMGIRRVDVASEVDGEPDLVVRLEAGTQTLETSEEYAELDFSPCAEAGTVLVGTVENLEATGDTKSVVAYIMIYVDECA